MDIKRIAVAATLTLAAGGALAGSPSMQASDAAGVWETATGGYVQFYQDNGAWRATIVGSSNGKPRYDTENPDESERGRRLLGVTFLHGLKYAGDGEFEGGKIYDPNSGKSYSAKATLKSHDALDMRGYLGFSLIGKTQTWHRIDPQAEHVHPDLLHKPLASTQ